MYIRVHVPSALLYADNNTAYQIIDALNQLIDYRQIRLVAIHFREFLAVI